MTLEEMLNLNLISRLQEIELINFYAYDGKSLASFKPFDIVQNVSYKNPIFKRQKDYIKYKDKHVLHIYSEDGKMIVMLNLNDNENNLESNK